MPISICFPSQISESPYSNEADSAWEGSSDNADAASLSVYGHRTTVVATQNVGVSTAGGLSAVSSPLSPMKTSTMIRAAEPDFPPKPVRKSFVALKSPATFESPMCLCSLSGRSCHFFLPPLRHLRQRLQTSSVEPEPGIHCGQSRGRVQLRPSRSPLHLCCSSRSSAAPITELHVKRLGSPSLGHIRKSTSQTGFELKVPKSPHSSLEFKLCVSEWARNIAILHLPPPAAAIHVATIGVHAEQQSSEAPNAHLRHFGEGRISDSPADSSARQHQHCQQFGRGFGWEFKIVLSGKKGGR